MRYLFSFFLLLSFFLTPSVHASCIQPTVDVVIGELTPEGFLEVTAHYNFGEAWGRLWWWYPGDPEAHYFDRYGAGTVDIGTFVSCHPAGSYEWRAIAATMCQGVEAQDSATYNIADETPSVSFDYTGPDQNGNLQVTITYAFDPQQTTYNIRKLVFFKNGVSQMDILAPQMSGTLPPLSVSIACSASSTELKAVATACGHYGNPQWEDQEIKNYGADATPKINIKPVKTNTSGGYDIEIFYDFTETGSSPAGRTVRLETVPAKDHPGGTVIDTYTNLAATGTITDSFTVAAGVEGIRAIATACSRSGHDEAALPPADKSCCTNKGSNEVSGQQSVENSNMETCVGTPIRVTNGNMRYNDSDPIPGPERTPFTRTYDSGNESSGVFGHGWTSPFDSWLRKTGGGDGRETVVIGTEQNDRYSFLRIGTSYVQTWPEGARSAATLSYDPGAQTFALREPNSLIVQVFSDSTGHLIEYRSLQDGNDIIISYDGGGVPERVEDAFGRFSWTITPGAGNRIASIAVDGYPGIVWNYAYGGDDTLDQVSLGTVVWRSYEYTTPGKNLLTARDPLNNLIESHAYDGSGRATTSVDPTEEITSVNNHVIFPPPIT